MTEIIGTLSELYVLLQLVWRVEVVLKVRKIVAYILHIEVSIVQGVQ